MIQIGIDFQGWPVDALTLKEILTELGFKEENGKVFIEDDNPILKAYPCVLEDDGMGYGINPEYVTSVDNSIYDKKVKTVDFENEEDENNSGVITVVKEETISAFNFFRSMPDNKTEDDE